MESSSDIRKVGLQIPEAIYQQGFCKCRHGAPTAEGGRSRGGEKRRNDNNYIFPKRQRNASHEAKCFGEVSHFIFVTALGCRVLYGPFYSDENQGRKHPINYPKSHRGFGAKLRCRECLDFSSLSRTLWGEATRRRVLPECVGKPQSIIHSAQQNQNNDLKL